MFKAAYTLSENMMPFSKFHVLVKCLRDNDVKLVSGRDNHKAAEEYVEYIAEVIREKLASFNQFFSSIQSLDGWIGSPKNWARKRSICSLD